MTDRAKMEAARDLIRDKDYGAARAILKTVDSTTAQEWLEKIAILEGAKAQRGNNRAYVAVGLIILVVIVLVFGSIAYTNLNNYESTNIANIQNTVMAQPH